LRSKIDDANSWLACRCRERRPVVEVDVQHESAGEVGVDHVGVRPNVAADREAPWRRVHRLRRADLAGVGLDVGCEAALAVGEQRQHVHAAAEVVGDQQLPARWMEAGERRLGAAAEDRVQGRELAALAVDGERADGPLLVGPDAIRLIE
jgi:hypothetical protein